MRMSPPKLVALAGAVALAAGTLTACGPSASGEQPNKDASKPIRVVYQKTSTFAGMDDLMKKVKTDYEAKYAGRTVELVPIEAEQDQYFTKLALMNGSAKTAPDVIYEDTFQIRSDVAAGYLQPIDEYVGKWEDWSKFVDGAKQAGVGDDGKIYGVSTGTDTRGLYFHKGVFKQAGLPADWAPKTWDDVLAAARTIKENVPDVIPFDINTGKARGEETTMQGFEMLMYGTEDELYENGKWTTGSKGFRDALAFYNTVYSEKLGPEISQALDTKWGSKVQNELLPKGKIGIALNGSWLPSTWLADPRLWPKWQEELGMAPMPTQTGQEPGATSMSGGWALAIGAKCEQPQEAFDLIAMAMSKDNAKQYYKDAGQIAVRSDIAEDPDYLSFNPTFEFFSSLVPVTHFRPATPDYPQISTNIAVAVEAAATGQRSPEEAQADYDKALIGIVGQDKTQAK